MPQFIFSTRKRSRDRLFLTDPEFIEILEMAHRGFIQDRLEKGITKASPLERKVLDVLFDHRPM